MKINTVTYSKKFPYAPYLNIDIGFEASLDSDGCDDPIQVLKQLDALAEQYYRDKFPHPSTQAYQEQETTDVREILSKIPHIQYQQPSYDGSLNNVIVSVSEPSKKLSQQELIESEIQRADTPQKLKEWELLSNKFPQTKELYQNKLNQLTND